MGTLPTNRIKKIKLPGDNNGDKTYDIIPTMLQDGTTTNKLSVPSLSSDNDEIVTIKTDQIITGHKYFENNYGISITPDGDLSTTLTANSSGLDITFGGLESTGRVSIAGNLEVAGYDLKLNKISAPTSSGGSTYGNGSSGQVLKSNGTTVYWATDTAGSGDVVGPASSTTNAIPLYSDGNGKTIKNSSLLVGTYSSGTYSGQNYISGAASGIADVYNITLPVDSGDPVALRHLAADVCWKYDTNASWYSTSSSTKTLGTSTYKWDDLYLASNLYLGSGGKLTASNTQLSWEPTSGGLVSGINIKGKGNTLTDEYKINIGASGRITGTSTGSGLNKLGITTYLQLPEKGTSNSYATIATTDDLNNVAYTNVNNNFSTTQTFSNSRLEVNVGPGGSAGNDGILFTGYSGNYGTTKLTKAGGGTYTLSLPQKTGVLAVTTDIPDIPSNQETMTVVAGALTNINGRTLSSYEATLTESTYTYYTITYGGVKCTEEQARNYMEYMTGSRYLPQYDYEKPKNSIFMFSDRTFWKPQYDSTNGLQLYRLSTALGLEKYSHNIRVAASGSGGAGSSSTSFAFKLITGDNTALTYTTLAGALYNAGFTSSTSYCPASGIYTVNASGAQTTGIVTGVYSTSSSASTIYIAYYTIASTSTTTMTVNSTSNTTNTASFTLTSAGTVDMVRESC